MTTGRPALAHASIPPLTLTGSYPLPARYCATFCERPPALQMTYNFAVWVNLVEPGRHLTHRDVPGVRGVTALPLVVLTHI